VSQIVPRDNPSQAKMDDTVLQSYMSLADVLVGFGLVDSHESFRTAWKGMGVQATVVPRPEPGDLSWDEFVLPSPRGPDAIFRSRKTLSEVSMTSRHLHAMPVGWCGWDSTSDELILSADNHLSNFQVTAKKH
jgi:hypothetical protein